MSDYGMHPTRYEGLSNSELYSMYRSAVYNNLNEREKLDLLQETVNRDAVERGEIGSPRVSFSSLPSNVSGNAANGEIHVNYDMAVKGIQTVEYNGQTIEHQMEDHNIQALNTVLHENAHCWQDQVNDGTISIADDHLAAEYKANDFTTTAVLQDGKYSLGSQYLTGETPGGYYFYYFQSTERDAHLQAEQKTADILQDITGKYGTEKSFEAYAKSVETNGYYATEQKAMELFNNPNFEQDVNQTLMNQYYGLNVPVDKNTETALKNEMVESYQSMNRLSSEEENKMSFDPKPVSLEEYNQSLRDTVNSYYEHAKNDPTMSNEEVVQSTGQMAEQYQEAVDTFQAEMNSENAVGTENLGESAGEGTVSSSGGDLGESAGEGTVSSSGDLGESAGEGTVSSSGGDLGESVGSEGTGESIGDEGAGESSGGGAGEGAGEGADPGGEDCDDGLDP
jgi:hypothetical protein